MPSIEMLTINDTCKNFEDFLEIVWRAIEYFPKGVWDEIKYLGNIIIKHDIKIEINGEPYEAFIFNNLLDKIKRIRMAIKTKDLLLAITVDPVVAIYSRLGSKGVRRMASLVHDYVSTDIGIISLFAIEGESAAMVAAHGLGHSRGLRHHGKPIDLMYEGLLENKTLDKEGFCESCLRKIVINKDF
ncbi:MAG: hypothetical protein QXW39_01240 [Candidatus Bathyarchaeia archaeon]